MTINTHDLTQANTLSLSDLIPNDELTDLVRNFAEATDVASAIVQHPSEKYLAYLKSFPYLWESTPSSAKKHNISKIRIQAQTRVTPTLHKFKGFCSLVRRSRLGNLRCLCCDIENGFKAYKSKKITTYKCHMGLRGMVVPILIGGRHVADILAGPTSDEKNVDTGNLRNQYENLSLAKRRISFDLFEKERNKVPIPSREKLSVMRRLLQALALFIGERAASQGILQIIDEIGREIGPNPDLNVALSSFITHVKRLLNCDTGSIWLLDVNDPDYLKGVTCDWTGDKEKDQKLIAEPMWKDHGGLAGVVITSGTPLLLNTKAEIDSYKPHNEQSRKYRDFSSFLGVPIFVDGTIVGVFEIGSKQEYAFHESNVPLLSTLALHAGAFSMQARLSTALMDIIPARDFSSLVNQVVKTVPHLVNGYGASLFVRPNESEPRAFLVASTELKEELIITNLFTDNLETSSVLNYDEGEGLTGWVLATGKPLILELIEGESRDDAVNRFNQNRDSNLPELQWNCKNSDERFKHMHLSWIGVPLINSNNRVIGVLRVSARVSGNFSSQELRVMETFAVRVTSAIDEEINRTKSDAQVFNIVTSLANAVDAKDPYTEGHSQHVRQFSIGIGQQLGLTHNELQRLGVAALLHDIGKIGIPDLILSKPGKLNRAESMAMQMHPVIGNDILKNITGIDDILNGILQHHESVNGEGYPNQLKGGDISLFAKIIAVADVFDAIRAKRPYKDSMEDKVAFQHIREHKGILYDDQVVDAFLSQFGKLYLDDEESSVMAHRIKPEKKK